MDLIYCQRDIPREQWRYGLRTSAATGCGWIAAYNALLLLGDRELPEVLIRWFERALPVIHGNLGTWITAPATFMKRRGYRVETILRRDRFDEALETCDAAILFYWWHQKLRLGAHFVALHKTPEGIVGYNTYRNSTGPDHYGASLERFLKRRKYFGAALIAIKKPE